MFQRIGDLPVISLLQAVDRRYETQRSWYVLEVSSMCTDLEIEGQEFGAVLKMVGR